MYYIIDLQIQFYHRTLVPGNNGCRSIRGTLMEQKLRGDLNVPRSQRDMYHDCVIKKEAPNVALQFTVLAKLVLPAR